MIPDHSRDDTSYRIALGHWAREEFRAQYRACRRDGIALPIHARGVNRIATAIRETAAIVWAEREFGVLGSFWAGVALASTENDA